MRRFFTTFFTCLLAVVAMAQSTALRGTIIAEGTEEAIVGAKITLGGQNISTTTNQSGEFALIYLEAMDEEVIIEASGYMTAIRLVQLTEGQTTDMGKIELQVDLASEVQTEMLLQLAENELNDDEGRGQSMSSNTSASTDVFNAGTGYAWSSVRYRQRGYEQKYEQTYINGLNFNSQERGQFNYSMVGGLNDASRNKDVFNGIESNGFTFGTLGQSNNILMRATNYAQGWKVGAAGTNRNYKGRVNALYSSGLLDNGWAFAGQLAWRYSPYINQKGIIGEGITYNSLGYFFSAEKVWGDNHSLSLVTFGAPTERGQSAGVTQEAIDLTGTIYYNPYWGYQNGKMRNSRIVKSFDPTAIASYEWKITDEQTLKVGLGYHYSFYSNSALTFYNAPDPRPDYYRNMPSFLFDGQINEKGQFITKDKNGKNLGEPFKYNGTWVGPTVDKDAFISLTDAWTSRDNATTQINWDALYAANYQNNAVNPEGAARYMLERRHNDLQEGMFSANYQNTEFDHLKITAGAEVKLSQGIHYKTIDDLLGGYQWIDVDPFAERDIKELATNIGLTQADIENVKQNNIHNPNAAMKDGDRFGYDYRINMTHASVWAQNEWSFNEVDFYYALRLTYSGINRSTDMLNGRAWYLAQLNPSQAFYYLGKSYEQILNGQYSTRYNGWNHNFFDPAFKLGVNYKIDGRNQLRLNAMAMTEAPLARDAYISPRVHDRAVEAIYIHDRATNLKEFYMASQKSVSYDLTYEFNYPIVRGRVTAYQSHFWNGTELNGYYDDETRTFVNQSMTGINRVHRGIEAAAAIKCGTYITLTPMLAIGDYHYTSNALAVTSAENGMALAENANGSVFELRDSVMIKGLKVATGPQLNTSLKISFFHPKMWFADLTISYFDWSYLDYAPARRMKGLYTGTRADGTSVNGSYKSAKAIETDNEGNQVVDEYGKPVLKYPYNILDEQESLVDGKWYNRFMIDASVGKLIYLPNRQSLSINLSVSNLTNNTHMKTGGYQQSRLPRSTKQGSDESVITPNVWKFPAKYYYAWGANFFLSLTYKF